MTTPETTVPIIVIDGTDASGKGTQVELLVTRLKVEGYAVGMLDFPRYETDTGKRIRAMQHGAFGNAAGLDPYFASPFFADDRKAAIPDMLKMQKRGLIIVQNRGVMSNLGHQGAKIPELEFRKKFYDWNLALEHEKHGFPRPTVNIILRLPLEFALMNLEKRGREKDGHENEAHLRAATAIYAELCDLYPNECVPIDCTGPNGDGTRRQLSPGEVHARIWATVVPHLANVAKTA